MIKLNKTLVLASIGLFALPSLQLQAQVVKEDRQVGSFTSIEVGGAFDVILKQSGKNSVVVEADQDIMDQIETEVRSGELRITQKGNIKNFDVMRVYVEFKDLTGLRISGAAEVESREVVRGQDLELRMSGAGHLDLLYEGESLDVNMSGASNLTIEGKVKKQKVRISGAGNYHAYELECRELYVQSSGAGNAKVSVSDKLEAYAHGAGSISYRGDPERVYEDASGAGNISRR